MADPSKSSQTGKNVAIALLALWSIISLIVIVVWSTSPDLKGSAHCHAKLQGATDELEDMKVALEKQVKAAQETQDRQSAQILVLLGNLNATNHTLEEFRQENLILLANVSVLQENITQLLLTEANLTAQISLQQDLIDTLEHNLTQAVHQTKACISLRAAAESQMSAAQTQRQACESEKQFLRKKHQKCKQEDSKAPTQAPASDASPLSGIPALMLLICSTLCLIT